jgi:hypothetical protein
MEPGSAPTPESQISKKDHFLAFLFNVHLGDEGCQSDAKSQKQDLEEQLHRAREEG